MIKKCLCLLLFVSLAKMLHGISITSVRCGAWSSASTWDLNRIPLPTDTIVVNSFVSFDVDFTSNSPGLLDVTVCGTLCGLHSYTGHFVFRGVVYLNTLTADYGASASYSNVNIQQMATVTGQGSSYTVYSGSVCVGCTSHCQNCSTNNRADSVNCSQNAVAVFSQPQITMFPNPVCDLIMLQCESALGEVILTNALGKELKRMVCQQEHLQIDMRDLVPGLYLVAIRGRHYKIIKQ